MEPEMLRALVNGEDSSVFAIHEKLIAHVKRCQDDIAAQLLKKLPDLGDEHVVADNGSGSNSKTEQSHNFIAFDTPDGSLAFLYAEMLESALADAEGNSQSVFHRPLRLMHHWL